MRPNQVFHRASSEVLEWLVLFKLGEFPCRRMPIGNRWINSGDSKTGEPVFISQHGHDGQGGESLDATRYFCWLAGDNQCLFHRSVSRGSDRGS